MTVSVACPCTETCPLKKVSDALGGKWKLSILCSLNASGATRYNDLKRKIKWISNIGIFHRCPVIMGIPPLHNCY